MGRHLLSLQCCIFGWFLNDTYLRIFNRAYFFLFWDIFYRLFFKPSGLRGFFVFLLVKSEWTKSIPASLICFIVSLARFRRPYFMIASQMIGLIQTLFLCVNVKFITEYSALGLSMLWKIIATEFWKLLWWFNCKGLFCCVFDFTWKISPLWSESRYFLWKSEVYYSAQRLWEIRCRQIFCTCSKVYGWLRKSKSEFLYGSLNS
jgi:hypothetical protein